MTNGLGLFLAFYILVGQPAILGWMLENNSLYQLAGLNAGIFLIAWIISMMCKPSTHRKKSQKSGAVVTPILAEKEEPKSEEIKEEIVETPKEPEIEVIEENAEEVKEEPKEEEKAEEKVVKESVSIPKIVQPLSGYPTSKKKRKKDVKWGQWVVLLLTLGIAAIITFTLREFLEYRGIAIALLLGWILYLIIGKLFDIDGFYNAKKLFTNWLYIVLILAGIGYGVYALQQEDGEVKLLPEGWSDKAIEYVKDWFKSDKNENPEINTGAIYIFEGTGEVIDPVQVENITAEVENTETNTGDVENNQNSEPENDVESQDIAEDQAPELSPEEAKKQVTMGEAIRSILAGTTLSTKTNSTFRYVSKSNELYPYFKTAQEKGMIGTDADPSKIVSCETYITMKGLAEGWSVGSYAKSEIKSAYWKKATELGVLNGCQKGKYVTKANL